MSNYGLTSYTQNSGNSPVPFDLTSNTSWLSAALSNITRFVYAGRWIDAQREISLAALKAKSEERAKLLDSLTKIALQTKDDQMRNQMFHEIMILFMRE